MTAHPMFPSVLLAILTHHDLPRLERALRTARAQRPADVTVETLVMVNTLDAAYASRAVDLSRAWGVRCVVSESNGRPGRGKNACLDALLASDCDYLCQLDGDDWLYPTWALSAAEHLRRAPALDVVELFPVDCVGSTAGYHWWLPDGAPASVWTSSAVYPWGSGGGPGMDGRLWTEHPTCPARTVMVSRKAAERRRFNEDLAVNEDYLLILEYLSDHIAGDLQVWLTMGSNWMVNDWRTPGSVTDVHAHDVDAFHALALGVVRPERSSIEELPILYPALLLTVEEKRRWIDELHIPARPEPDPG